MKYNKLHTLRMNTDTDKLIISLIKDDLINSKLINGLIDLGMDAGAHYLQS